MGSTYIITPDGNFMSEDELYHTLQARNWKEAQQHKYISREWGKKGWIYKYPTDQKTQAKAQTQSTSQNTNQISNTLNRGKNVLSLAVSKEARLKTDMTKASTKIKSAVNPSLKARNDLRKANEKIKSAPNSTSIANRIMKKANEKISNATTNAKPLKDLTQNNKNTTNDITEKVKTVTNNFLDKNAKREVKDLNTVSKSENEEKSKVEEAKNKVVKKVFDWLYDKAVELRDAGNEYDKKVKEEEEKRKAEEAEKKRYDEWYKSLTPKQRKVEDAAKAYAEYVEKNNIEIPEKFNTLKRIEGSNTDNDLNQSMINPNYYKGVDDYGYSHNCACCTLTYDLRRRGYDVEAVPRSKEEGGLRLFDMQRAYQGSVSDFRDESGDFDASIEISKETASKYKDAGKFVRYSVAYDKYYTATEESIAKMEKEAKEELDAMPDNSYGNFGVSWTSGGGHSMVWEKENGEIIIRDCQTNTKYTYDEFTDEYKNEYYCVATFRLDNKVPGEEILQYVRNRK